MDALDKLIERHITADERLKGMLMRVAEGELRMRQAKLRAEMLEETLRGLRAQFAIEDLRAERDRDSDVEESVMPAAQSESDGL